MQAMMYTLMTVAVLSVVTTHRLQDHKDTSAMHQLQRSSQEHYWDTKNANVSSRYYYREKDEHRLRRLYSPRLSLEVVSQNQEVLVPVVVKLMQRLYGTQKFFQALIGREEAFVMHLLEHYKDDKKTITKTKTTIIVKVEILLSIKNNNKKDPEIKIILIN